MLHKRITASILASLFTALLCAASCGEEVVVDNSVDNADSTLTETSKVTTELSAELPDVKYDGHVFNILITGNTENTWQKNDFKAEELTGEVLNDARYERNLAVEERFDITIATDERYGATKGAGSGFTMIQNCVMAGDSSYDAGMIAGYDCATLALGGYLYDMRTLPYIDLDKPWWDQRLNEDLTINGKLYYSTGDISTADNDATGAILFNNKLVEDFSLPNPYEMVLDGSWTVDAMISMGKDVSSDLDGNSVWDKNDRYAAIIWDDTVMGVINSTGEKCATVQPDGRLELTLYNERVLSMFEKFTTAYYDTTQAYHYQRVSYDITDPVAMFANDQALFFMQLLDLVTYFRDMKTDFGILPLPKLDEEQDRYYSTIGSWHSVFLCAPSVQENAERTGAILEALAYESYKTVTPAYYEKTLVGKYIRDDESREMVDIILSSHVYDLGWFYQIGKYCDEVLYMWYDKKSDFTSMYDSHLSAAMADIERINEAFAELE